MEGVHVMAGEGCDRLKESLLASSRELLPLLRKLIPDDSWPGKGKATFDRETLARLVEARLDGDLKQFENTSEKMDGTPPSVLFTIVDAIAGPVLAALAGRLDESFSRGRWNQGTCPFCGSLPSIGFLSRRDPNDLEHLVGGGGKKHLHCSLCSLEWEYRRDTCPACGNTDQKTREIFFVDGAKHERIEACHQCGTYGLCIDLRECELVPQLDAAQMGLMHLDMIAQERSLTPMAPTTWNSFKP
ncbi:formate dehydrogenase accessory protein FdhE [Salidesulfovibrio onnuriiensis]|uniref:formate dehydrogenase accessory protein FdhE n=1 Tax=Salidesulfovibrio onnuriiensis TaxID=2583823 RepID=UPI0011C88912|nr:formate dehydrogenase accessory protein FdhE [Salidesulfovibrio onnuriiensis]